MKNTLDIATILFTYNRPEHTRKVLEALRKNTILPTKMYIFQDGIKGIENLEDWKKVSQIIKQVNWCKTEVRISRKNKGLAASQIFGQKYVFRKHDAIIVLEDDCVPHPLFMEYMITALNKYYDNPNVYNINGNCSEYRCKINVEPNGHSAYFTGRIDSCGWGTWKNRWVQCKWDYRILGRIKNNKELDEQFHLWGEDLESYLLGNIYGICNSWATFWALTVIEKKGYCLTPYESFITNIGFDGSGANCGSSEVIQQIRRHDDMGEIKLPDAVCFPPNYKLSYRDAYSWISNEIKLECYNKILKQIISLKERDCIADYLIKKDISNVSIYGKGVICRFLMESLKGKVNILSIIETSPKTVEYEKTPIKPVSDIPANTQLIICIPVYDILRIKINIEQYGCFNVMGVDTLLKNVLQ